MFLGVKCVRFVFLILSIQLICNKSLDITINFILFESTVIKFNLFNKQVMESSKQIKLTLHRVPNAASKFPIDPKGHYTITSWAKTYQCQGYLFDYSKVLERLLANETKIDLSQVLIHGTNEEVAHCVMQLLFGLNDVILELLEKCFTAKISFYTWSKKDLSRVLC